MGMCSVWILCGMKGVFGGRACLVCEALLVFGACVVLGLFVVCGACV